MFGCLVWGLVFFWLVDCLLVFFKLQHGCSAARCFANVSVVLGKVPKHWPVQIHFFKMMGSLEHRILFSSQCMAVNYVHIFLRE